MSLTDRFVEYAAAFEESFADDDWSRLEPYFTENAVYATESEAPFAGCHEGRAAILSQFKSSLDGFDRRFGSRRLELVEGPKEDGNAVWIQWAAVYTLAGAPDLRIEGEERITFDGDRIARIDDRIPRDSADRTTAYMTDHAAKLLG